MGLLWFGFLGGWVGGGAMCLALSEQHHYFSCIWLGMTLKCFRMTVKYGGWWSVLDACCRLTWLIAYSLVLMCLVCDNTSQSGKIWACCPSMNVWEWNVSLTFRANSSNLCPFPTNVCSTKVKKGGCHQFLLSWWQIDYLGHIIPSS